LRGKIQTIFIDPPYGIKFGSNWQSSTKKRETKDGKIEFTTRQPEQIKAFRDTWSLGIHSYLSYLRDRLSTSRQLLTETGNIFVQIGVENVHLIRALMDEVFGAENFCNLITFKKTLPLGADGLPSIADYLVWYAKDIKQRKFRSLYEFKPLGAGTGYTWVEDADGSRRKMTTLERNDTSLLPKSSKAFFADNLLSSGFTESCFFDLQYDGRKFHAQKYSWKTNRQGIEKLIVAKRLIAPGGLPNYVRYFNDFPVQTLHNVWDDTHGASDPVYVVQTSNKVLERCLLLTTDPGDLVLDPTCGSGTTAYVAEQWGRRWITCDTSRVALALARTRLMSAKFPYYLLADSPEGVKKEAELTGQIPPNVRTDKDIKKGFVYKRVPHVTLKSIANNPDIKEGMSRETSLP
jgi:adenine-specific DNA-methyltransferase